MWRVLLIEDNASDADFICTIFRRMRTVGEIETETSLLAGVERLLCESFDVVLADLSLPDASGVQVVTVVRQAAEYVAIVALTDLMDNSVAEKAIQEDAQDYLVKDLMTADSLERSILHASYRQAARNKKLRMLHTAEHVEELLKQKNRRLKRLYSIAQEFVAYVSHEFRTPLSVIKDYVSIIGDGVVGALNEEQRRLLGVVDDRADDLNTIVDDLLDVSKLNVGLLSIWRNECTVESIIEQVLPAIERKAIARGTAVRLHLESGLPHVYCDAEKAGRVIVNLCVNAINATRDGSSIELWSRIDADHSNVLVGVTDNGPGIHRKRLRTMFESLSRAETGVRGNLRAFGLRLNVAFELAKLNLGKLSVVSEVGHGSTFSFTLPVAIPREIVSRYLAQIETKRHGATTILLLLAEFDERICDSRIGDAERFLSNLVRRNDLLLRSEESKWLLLLPMPRIELQSFLDRAEQRLSSVNRNRPFAALPHITYKMVGVWSPGEEREVVLTTVDRWCSASAMTMV